MAITLLLDLDDTLLDIRMDNFLPLYLAALGKYLDGFAPADHLIAALRHGWKAMLGSRDLTRTLQQVFDAIFYPELGLDPAAMSPALEEFYTHVFPGLGQHLRPHAGAVELIEWARRHGHEVALATDPLFPRLATEARVRWAGLDPSWFRLISTYETFHFSKSHVAYFAELLGRLGWPDHPVVVAGNDMMRDVIPARALGLTTFHVNGAPKDGLEPSPPGDVDAQPGGRLQDLNRWLERTALEPAAPAVRTRESVIAVLESTPGALYGLTSGLRPEVWRVEPSENEWAIIELVCHLRDTEREVHAAQLQTLIVTQAPFVARPEVAVWAKQRRYLEEDGSAALRSFAQSRAALVGEVQKLPEGIWDKPARHAIFGPTTFGEVLGFMADHDRLHLQQARSTLAALEAAAHPN